MSDQLYLEGCKSLNITHFEKAARLFKIDRDIAVGPAIFYVKQNKASEEALIAINNGLKFDPYAADLLRAKMTHSFKLGKTSEALDAYNKLAAIEPNNKLIKCLSEVGYCSFNPN